MDKEKFEKVLNYFNDLNIEVPTEVKNAIEDVFMENDDIKSVDIFHIEDIESFQETFTLVNDVKMWKTGKNIGQTNNVWTYYGDITYSLSESILLLDEYDQTLEVISKLENNVPTTVNDPNSYAVVFLEKVNWNSEKKEYSRDQKLSIYCPISLETSSDPEKNKYDKIYNNIKKESLDGNK